MKEINAIAGGLLAACLLGSAVTAQAGLLERWRERQAERHAQQAPTDTASHALTLGGQRRSYTLLDGRHGSGPAPLLVVLHGGGGNGANMLARWSAIARREGLIVAAPDGIGRQPRMGTWNAGGCCGEALAQGLDDVQFVSAVIDEVSRTLPVDRRRIYIAGFSNGGMLTHRLAIALAERIAGAAVVAGALFGDEARPKAPVPMLILHGQKDQVVGYDGGMSPTAFVARAQAKPFVPVRQAVEFWRSADGCSTPAVVTRQGDARVETSQCQAGAEVLFYSLASLDHAWPETAAPAGASIDASALIWAFFQRHAR